MNASRTALCLLAALALTALPAAAHESGDRDTAYGTNGITQFDHDGWVDQGVDLAIDSQGRIVVASISSVDITTEIHEWRAVIARYLSDGSIDGSFGSGGSKQLFDYIPLQDMSDRGSLAIGPGDEIYFGFTIAHCAGTCPPDATNADFMLVRLDVYGTIVDYVRVAFDFGSEPSTKHDRLYDITILADGRIALAGTIDRQTYADKDKDFGLAVLKENAGTGYLELDTSFDVTGKTACAFDLGGTAGKQDIGYAVAQTPSGTIIVGGTAFVGDGLGSDGTDVALCEFSSVDGSFIRSYHEIGLAALDDREELRDMVVLPDGDIIAAGMLPGDGGFDFAVLKITRDMTFGFIPDTSFSGNGWASVGFTYPFVGATNDYLHNVLVEPDGGIMVAGTIFDPVGSAVEAWGIARFTPDGDLDTGFGIGGGGGRTIYNTDTDLDDTLYGLVRQDDGKLVMSGRSSIDFEYDATTMRIYSKLIFTDGFEGGNLSQWTSSP